jgi:hypothetical protein
MVFRLLCWSLLAAAGFAQPVKVYSEFQRVDPFGHVVPMDRATRPREILSPALARGAWASYVVALTPPEGKPWWVFIGQNPENAVEVRMYKPVFARYGDVWIPDALEPLEMNDMGGLPSVQPQVPGQKTTVLWMDIRPAADAPVRRTRLEVQLNSGDDWVIYPLELRLQQAVVPQPSGAPEPLGRVDAPASDSAAAVLRGYACGGAPAGGQNGPLTVRSAIRRNARQDMALARSIETSQGRAVMLTELLDAAGLGILASFCKAPPPLADERGAEWYLRVRDLLYRTASGALTLSSKPTVTVKPTTP